MTRRDAFPSLLGGAAGLHAGDQLAMAAMPLITVLVLGGDAKLVGLLLALQAMAWMLCSLPAGLAVDRFGRRPVLLAAAALSALGLAIAAAGAAFGETELLGAGAFLGSAGTVTFVLAAASAVPDLVARERLPLANARLELARAMVTLAAPPLAGALAASGRPALAFVLATLAACCGLITLLRIGTLPPPVNIAPAGLRGALSEGLAFLMRDRLLRGIALCAVFWNMGFFVLLAAFVPFALGPMGLDPARIGFAQAGYGAGLLLGALIAPRVMDRLGANAVLIGGPALSVAAPCLMLLAPSFGSALPLALAGQFLVGFGPMMWLVCQQSIRQAVTPRALLGRVGATLQVAIYGVRPIGALAGGALAAVAGPASGIALAGLLFALSLVVVACSALARLRRLPLPVGT